jgi:hypothetical protein
MISLLEIAQNMNEADDDRYVSIGYGRYKEKGKEEDDNAEVYVKTDSGKFVKSSDQESDDDGGEKPQPGGSGLKPSDFERDFDDTVGDPDDEEAKAQAYADMEDEEDVEEESITINGVKYKPIKESVNEAVLTISYQPIFDADKKDKLEKIAKKSGLTIRSRGAQGFTVDGKRANVEKFIKATRGLIEIKESIKESKKPNPRMLKEIYDRTFRSLK